jgi:hypothetical protein
VATLKQFAAPARLAEPNEADGAAWSDVVRDMLAQFAAEFPQFYDPTAADTPADAIVARIGWPAFPAPLLRGATTETGRWETADDRDQQVEYCEWSVERDSDGTINRVTFSTEVPEFWEHVANRDPERLLAMYRELVDGRVEEKDLFDSGKYVPRNKWNTTAEGRLAHLVQKNNTLGAAARLAAEATVQRVDSGGRRVSDQQILVRCAGLGDEFRNSDPRIAAAVNDAAATGAEITLQDPIGLYLHEIRTTGMVTPERDTDRADPAAFWTIERGDIDHAVRASFAVPPELGFAVGDIKLDGRPIQFGAQLADRVTVRLTALVKPAAHEPRVEGCVT